MVKIILIISILFITTGLMISTSDTIKYKNIKKELYYIKKNKITNEKTINTLLAKTKSIKSTSKEKILFEIKEYKNYAELTNLINSNFKNNILNSTITEEEIESINRKYQSLSKNKKTEYKNKINSINYQYNKINEINSKINSLFFNNDKTNLNEGITLSKIEEYEKELESLPQNDIIIINKTNIELAKNIEKNNNKENIDNPWKILDVPYISQNQNNVLNGCEGAALLMALKYKGYMHNMSYNNFIAKCH